MSVKVGTLVNKKQESLISDDFEKAAALYQERSYEALVASRDILKEQKTMWNWILGVCFGICSLLVVIGMAGIASLGRTPPAGAADVWLAFFLGGFFGIFPTIVLVRVSERIDRQLLLTNIALQMHDRKDEIISALTK